MNKLIHRIERELCEIFVGSLMEIEQLLKSV